jgi:hypothetical protein
MDIFRMLIATRYAVIPSPHAQAFLEDWMSNGDIGLRSLVIGILIAENRLDHMPESFRGAIDDELARSGLPNSVIDDPPNGSHHASPTEIIECVGCTQKLRLPSDKGKLSVSCPKCDHTFTYVS